GNAAFDILKTQSRLPDDAAPADDRRRESGDAGLPSKCLEIAREERQLVGEYLRGCARTSAGDDEHREQNERNEARDDCHRSILRAYGRRRHATGSRQYEGWTSRL